MTIGPERNDIYPYIFHIYVYISQRKSRTWYMTKSELSAQNISPDICFFEKKYISLHCKPLLFEKT